MQSAPESTPEERGGRIESHGKGVGAPTPEAVDRRAQEIAQTDSRLADAITEADRIRAERELHGETLALSSDDAQADLVASSNPADIAVETGHQVADMQPADEQRIMEEEVKEGVREAEHERMLEGQNNEENTGGQGRT